MTLNITHPRIDIQSTPPSRLRWRIDTGAALNVMRCGIGACWHAIAHPSDPQYAGSAWGGNPPADDEQAWRRLYELADWTGMSFLRVEVSQRMYEPERRVFTWESPEMRVLCRILDWCQSRGAIVFLQQMYNNVEWNAFPEFRGDAIGVLRSGPCSLGDYTHGLVSLVEHLIQERKYTCIRYLGLINEPSPYCSSPNCSCWRSPTQDSMPLLPAVEAVSRALVARNLPVVLAGPDYVETPCSSDIDALAPHLGAFEIHSYGGAFDWRTEHAFDWCYPMWQGVEKFSAWAPYAHNQGKPFFLGELGTFDYGMGGSKPEPGSYEACLKDVEYAIRLMNVGVDGFCRWSFVNRGDLDGQWQMVDTWDPERQRLRKEFGSHPNTYFLWGLISRFIPPGAKVVDCRAEGGVIAPPRARVFAAAVVNPDGTPTILTVNDAEQAARAEFKIIPASTEPKLFRYRVSAEDRDRSDLRVEPQCECGQCFEDILPPMSLTVYSGHQLAHSQPSCHPPVAHPPHPELWQK